MALIIRNSTVATTVDDIEQDFPGGLPAFVAAGHVVACVRGLVRLAAPVHGVRCGVWTACRGAYTAEVKPHPRIRLVTGRRRKAWGLVHRAVRLRDEPELAPPSPSRVTRSSSPDFQSQRHPPEHFLGKGSLKFGGPPFAVGGDGDAARARRIALWLCVRAGIAPGELGAQHSALLPAERFDVDATAVAWEMSLRFGTMASTPGNSVHCPKADALAHLDSVLAERGLAALFGAYRWPCEFGAAGVGRHGASGSPDDGSGGDGVGGTDPMTGQGR